MLHVFSFLFQLPALFISLTAKRLQMYFFRTESEVILQQMEKKMHLQ